MTHFDDAILSILDLYTALSYKPPHNQHTVLAAFFLSSPSTSKVISVATGTKCLPTAKFSERGEALHDCHAEVLARRAALRWFLEEIVRYHGPQQSQWICRNHENGKHHLRSGIQLNIYVSTLPCGDASMRYLATIQDEEMARLKDSSPQPAQARLDIPISLTVNTNDISSGRDGYSRLGVLRTKPGRADSPPTICMSCSDKIAAWNVHGIQGALGSHALQPLYISTVVIGGVPSDDDHLRQMIQEDCERALWARVANVKDLPHGFVVHKPIIVFTALPFIHSRAELIKTAPDTNTTNESLCWIADRKAHEILINGLKRGVSPKHRFRDKSRPLVCKYSIYQSLRDTLAQLSLQPPDSLTTYIEFKQTAQQYQDAKEVLRGQKGPFSAWIKSGSPWESFCLEVTSA